MSDAEIINAGRENGLGEGPLWLAENNQLLWVDVEAGKLWCHDAKAGRNVSRTLPKRPTSLARSASGIAIVFRRQIGFLRDFEDDIELVDVSRHLDERERLNDCTVDAEGRLWVGSMDVEQSSPLGRIFCLSPDLEFAPVASNFIVTNGLEWAEDGRTLFAVDSGTRQILALSWSESSRSAQVDHSVFAYPAGEMPDGMTMDAEGKLWVAIIGAGRIDRISQSGKRLGSIALPLENPTSCTIGGPDERCLYCTSMRMGMTDKEIGKMPASGSTLRIPIDSLSRPARPFAKY